MDLETYQRDLATQIAGQIKLFQFHKWDGSKWIETGLPTKKFSKVKLLRDRDQYDREKFLLKRLRPYIAWITAPSNIQREEVVDRMYYEGRMAEKKEKRAKGIITDSKGYEFDVTVEQKQHEFKEYKRCFEIFCQIIEKNL